MTCPRGRLNGGILKAGPRVGSDWRIMVVFVARALNLGGDMLTMGVTGFLSLFGTCE
jgi:hypothetical protein